jgi:hypothetical protein
MLEGSGFNRTGEVEASWEEHEAEVSSRPYRLVFEGEYMIVTYLKIGALDRDLIESSSIGWAQEVARIEGIRGTGQ